MGDKPWKQAERIVAQIIGGRRHPANVGGPVDAESDEVVAQVKHVNKLPLPELERLAVEIRHVGLERGKAGVVFIKRRSGKGKETPWLMVMAVETPHNEDSGTFSRLEKRVARKIKKDLPARKDSA